MKIKIIENITEVEASAQELNASNPLADNFYNILRRAFGSSGYSGNYSEYEEENEVDDENS